MTDEYDYAPTELIYQVTVERANWQLTNRREGLRFEREDCDHYLEAIPWGSWQTDKEWILQLRTDFPEGGQVPGPIDVPHQLVLETPAELQAAIELLLAYSESLIEPASAD